jgi:hypothetical protein
MAPPLAAQGELNHDARVVIGGLVLTHQVRVGVEVQPPASGQQLFVPYCVEHELGDRVLCVVGSRLEVQAEDGWRPALPRQEGTALAGIPLRRARGRAVPPGSTEHFIFEFSKDFLAVDAGQRLRIVVDVWRTEESMRAGDASIKLTSPPFDCP